MHMDFSGKVALVTGGANGIGKATVHAFAKAGAKVAVVDRDEAGAKSVAEAVRMANGDAISFGADVTSADDVAAYVKATLNAYGTIDCFFNNAGIEGEIKSIIDYDEAMFDSIMNVNVKGVFLGMKHVLPVMLKNGSGAVVNTASVAGITGTPMMPAYCASKHAVIGLTKVASGEVARGGVRVNCVCPGPVATRMIESVQAQIMPHDPAQARANYEAALPTGRYTEPEEIADAVLFLTSDHSKNVTGTQFVVDSGRTATGGAATRLAQG
jgi:NAD(P)-dependent dehydrogenase (short-subunit alcohol dehydrogenase family)